MGRLSMPACWSARADREEERGVGQALASLLETVGELAGYRQNKIAASGRAHGGKRTFMGDDRAEDGTVSFDEAVMLLDEIERLRCKLAKYEERLAELDRLAYCDPLVDLPNRRSFLTALERLIKRVVQYDVPAAMLFADVDGLKVINDKFGHNAGDKTLIEVSRLLVAGVRKGDFVGRLAGDEFGILLEHASELSAWQMALRVVETVDEHQFCVEGHQVPLSVAVGVAVIQRADTPQSVLARADKEMYRIKRVGPPAPHLALID